MRFFYWYLFFLPTIIFGQSFKIEVNTEQGYDDYILLNFDSLSTDTFDFNYDGIKFVSQNGYPTIYSTDSNLQIWYSLNTMKPITIYSKKIDFNVLPGIGTNINLRFLNFSDLESYVILWDKKLNVYQVLNSDTTYNYNVDPDTFDYRFRITFYPKPIIFLDTLDCHSIPVKLKLSLSDSTSPHMNFSMYNTSLTYVQEGHFGEGVYSLTTMLPSGSYYLKLGLIPPQDQTFLNTWIKQYFFIIDTITPIDMNLYFSNQEGVPNQPISFTPTYDPSNIVASVNMGDGTNNIVIDGEYYQHSYSDTGSYIVTFKAFDPASNCTKTKEYTIKISYPLSDSYSTFSNGNLYYSNGNIIINPNINVNYIVNLYDISGRLVERTALKMVKNNNYNIGINHLSSGVYVVELFDNKKRFTKKILKINN